jgi:hypothetical protein
MPRSIIFRPVTMEYMSSGVVIGIVVVLILLGVGIVINQLFRLKQWLKNSPSDPDPDPEPPES